jgi:hypothetical protein
VTQNVIAATNGLPQVFVSQFIATSETTQYTCPASSSVAIDAATVANSSGAACEVFVSLVRSGGTAGNANRIAILAGTGALQAGDSTVLSELEGHKLGPGDFISAIAQTASAVSLVISGTVLS